MAKKLVLIGLSLTCAAILVAVLIYPGLYIYVPVDNSTDVYRVNRVTGLKQLATQWGWKTESEAEALYAVEQDRKQAAFDAQIARFEQDASAGQITGATWKAGRLVVQYTDGHSASAEIDMVNQSAVDRANEALTRHGITVGHG
jgi:hypothetical protein